MMLLCSSVGLLVVFLLGYLTTIIAFFVWQLIREGFGTPKQMAIPALFLLSMFGTALVYLAVVVFESWPVFIGAAITFAHGARPLFTKDEDVDQAPKS